MSPIRQKIRDEEKNLSLFPISAKSLKTGELDLFHNFDKV